MIRIIICCILFLSFYTSCNNATTQTDVVTTLDSIPDIKKEHISLDFITGAFSPEADSSFVSIDIKHADREGMFIKKEAYDSFIKMWKAAKKDGINLVIRSAARNFEYQKGIWERKWTGQTILSDGSNANTAFSDPKVRALKILEYSSMPGSSRHHWGTDIDLNNFNNSWFESGEGLRVFEWLSKNASDYGFCRPYTKKDSLRPNGYNEEKWHWSYFPLSNNYTAFAEANLKDSMVSGFKGSEVCSEIDIVNNYVLGISQDCK